MNKLLYLLSLVYLFSSLIFAQDTLQMRHFDLFAQDNYPYFSDINKQLEFEQKRIYINETEIERQYISGGGDEFNWWSLLVETEPEYKTAPIETSFYYEYKFEIINNGVRINEVEFLRLIGLENQADKIINSYIKQLKLWEKEQYYTITKNIWDTSKWEIYLGFIFFIGAIGLTVEVDFLLGLTSFIGGIYFILKAPVKQVEIVIENPQPKPVLKQKLTNEQINSLAESYNRRLYEEIKSNN